MYPRAESRVEELHPLIPNMKDKRATKKQVSESETGGHSSEIKQIPAQRGDHRPQYMTLYYVHVG